MLLWDLIQIINAQERIKKRKQQVAIRVGVSISRNPNLILRCIIFLLGSRLIPPLVLDPPESQRLKRPA